MAEKRRCEKSQKALNFFLDLVPNSPVHRRTTLFLIKAPLKLQKEASTGGDRLLRRPIWPSLANFFASCFPLEKEYWSPRTVEYLFKPDLGLSTWFFKKLLLNNNIILKWNKTLIEMPNDYGSFCRFNRNGFVNYMTFCTSTNWTEVDAYYMSSRAQMVSVGLKWFLVSGCRVITSMRGRSVVLETCTRPPIHCFHSLEFYC